MKTKAALILLLALTLSAVAACSSSPTTSQDFSTEAKSTETPKKAAEPKTEDGAKAAAQNEFDAYSAGDWGGTWDLWTAEGKAAFSRDDYIALHNECKTITGLPMTIKNVRMEGDRAIVRVERMSFLMSYTMRYQDNAWRFQPTVEDIVGYTKGRTALITEKKQAGTCPAS